MMKRMVSTLAAVGVLACLSWPALAGGPGSYTVKGNNGEPNTDYTGALTIAQTGANTFKLSWTIDGYKYDGFGIGTAEAIAVSFKSGDSNGTALLADDGAGGYKSIWAFNGDKKLGVEMITPKK